MSSASRRSLRPLALALVVTGLVAAGTAAAFFLRSRRDVTTSSEQARKAYNEARENDLKMYDREAISGYATALQYDPHFVMATLRLADKIRGPPPEPASSRPANRSWWGSAGSAGGGAPPRPSARSTTSTCVDSRTIPKAI